jgi:hypothetical protein
MASWAMAQPLPPPLPCVIHEMFKTWAELQVCQTLTIGSEHLQPRTFDMHLRRIFDFTERGAANPTFQPSREVNLSRFTPTSSQHPRRSRPAVLPPADLSLIFAKSRR